MPASEQVPENAATSDRLPLLDNGKPQTAPTTSGHRRPRRFFQIIALLALVFLGGVIGLYFQGPALRSFFKWTPLEPGAGARQPIAVPVDRVPSPERVAAMAKGDVIALGRLQPTGGIVSVALPAGAGDARIDKLLVAEGDLVSEGDLLAVLDSITQFEAALTSAESTLAIKRAALAQTIAQVAAAKAEAQANLQSAKVAAESAEASLRRTLSLKERSLASQDVLDKAQADASAARGEVARLKATLSRYEDGPDGMPVDVAVVKADFAAAEAAVAQARNDLDRARVFAPRDGTIIDVEIRVGERATNDGLLRMGNTARMEVELEVFQTMAPRVEIGQPVSITSGVLGEAPLTGTVSRIGILVGRQGVTADDPAANTDARVLKITAQLGAESSARAAKFINLEVVARIDVAADGEDAEGGK
jgi:HlyD family secretion protein